VRDGFTLVEVLVAVAVASLLILGVTASTGSAVRTAERQRTEARAEEERARAVELVREDWRGRLRVFRPATAPPVGVRVLQMSTTADSVAASGGRGIRLVTYTASEKGLARSEGGAELLLLRCPVEMDCWDGAVWRPEPIGRQSVLRLRLRDPDEILILR